MTVPTLRMLIPHLPKFLSAAAAPALVRRTRQRIEDWSTQDFVDQVRTLAWAAP